MSRVARSRAKARLVEQKDATTLPLPDYFGARGMLRDMNWAEAYINAVLQWPAGCTLSTRDRQLVGLAKSLAFAWEPGILNHTDLALRTGSSPEVLSEVLKAVSVTLGLARLDLATRSLSRGSLASHARRDLAQVRAFFGEVPAFFKRRIILEDAHWLGDFLEVSRPAYESRSSVIGPRLRALVCLAAAAASGWEEGIRLYGHAARKFGASGGEVSDVIKSVFKTEVSNAMAAGFRTPCHIPRLEKYRTILSAYVDAGALAKRKADRLETNPSS